jgi:catechol 2,3-dioxygenase-like lactoylglutathione lyase family enzyme
MRMKDQQNARPGLQQQKLDVLDHAAIRVKDVNEAVEWYTRRFRCKVEYQDATWAILAFDNVRLAFVLQEQHPPHIAIVGNPAEYGQPKLHRDGTSSVYLKDPDGNNVEILTLAPDAAKASS